MRFSEAPLSLRLLPWATVQLHPCPQSSPFTSSGCLLLARVPSPNQVPLTWRIQNGLWMAPSLPLPVQGNAEVSVSLTNPGGAGLSTPGAVVLLPRKLSLAWLSCSLDILAKARHQALGLLKVQGTLIRLLEPCLEAPQLGASLHCSCLGKDGDPKKTTFQTLHSYLLQPLPPLRGSQSLLTGS